MLVLRAFPILAVSMGLLSAPAQAQTSSPPPPPGPSGASPPKAEVAPVKPTSPAPPAAPVKPSSPTPPAAPVKPAGPTPPAPPTAAAPAKPAAPIPPVPPTAAAPAKPAAPIPPVPPAVAAPAPPVIPSLPAAPAGTPPVKPDAGGNVPANSAPLPGGTSATAALPAVPAPAPKPISPAPAAKPVGPPPSPAQVKKARELWYRGVDAFRNARYEEARQAFSECYALMPKSDVLRNLSISEIQSGHYVAAARHLTLLLSGADLPADVREEATRRLAQAEAQVGKLNVTVDVPGAVVSIDATPIGRTPLDGGWYLEPGSHEVTVSKPGYPNEARQIYALAGVAIPVTVSLEALRREQERDAHAAELMGTREGETPRDRGLGTASTITLISTGTLAAAGFIAGIYFTVAANGHDSDADAIARNLTDSRVCGATTQLGSDCQPFWQEQKDAHRDRQRAQVSFIGFGVASAATLGYALYLFLDDDDEAKAKPKLNSAHRLEPAFSVAADGASFSLQGQF